MASGVAADLEGLARSQADASLPVLRQQTVDQAGHIAMAVEQAGHDDLGRQLLLRQLTQRGRHDARIVLIVIGQHAHEAEFLRPCGPDVLLHARRGPRHDQRPLVE